MKALIPILVSAIIVIALVGILGRKLKLSSRYERAPRVLNTWSSQDHGIDPTDEKNL